MFNLTVENENGYAIDLVDTTRYTVYKIDGLNPPSAQIIQYEVPSLDGTKYKGSKLQARNIVINLYVNGNVSENRQELYKVFKSKRYVKFKFKTDNRNVFAEGYVENIEVDYFSNRETVQISIVCPQPYFESMEIIVNEFSNIIKYLSFPFGTYKDSPIAFSEFDVNHEAIINNDGDAESGFIIIFRATGPVKNPKLINKYDLTSMGVNIEMQSGDTITINTQKGSKSVTLLRNATESNIFNTLLDDRNWFQLSPGQNVFVYDADSGMDDLIVETHFRNKYQGV